ncbi:MAG: saccharopine dehydrogenase family protein [Phycisphaerales bacterium]|nr:saccharopine dehydrogenase family protein [Phycisphaerales bacterium]
MKAIVLGAGRVGAVMAADLARDSAFEVTVADVREEALARAREWSGGKARAVQVDLSSPAAIREAVGPFDVVLGSLASHLGFGALRAIIEAGKNYADISFMPEDAIDLDGLAKERGVTAVVDIGVAPGMSNLLAGYEAGRMTRCEEIEIYVGGLPKVRRWPFEYKAGFSPADVIEEYTRPARIVEHGKIVVREALSEPELMDLPHVGTVEAFNTDGLRSLAYTMKVPRMKEKTLRFPGHIELMRVFRETGLFSKEAIEVGGVRVKPLEVISALMFPKWNYGPGEADLTVMRIVNVGEKDGERVRVTWDLYDEYDARTGWTSMARTTAFPATIMARLIAGGKFRRPGVIPPELAADAPGLVEAMLAGLKERGVRYERKEEVTE